MTLEEKLKQTEKEFYEISNTLDTEDFKSNFRKGAEWAIQQLEPKWIDVRTPPKEGGRYWGHVKYLNDGGWWSYYQYNLSYDPQKNEWREDKEGVVTVTHWAELLPAPKED